MRRRRQLELGVVVLGISTVLLLVLLVAVGIAGAALSSPPHTPTSQGWKPPELECPEGIELWECIRGAMYRRDM